MIVSDPDIMLGKPTVEGTRITVESILEKLAAGRSHAEVLGAYPRLNGQDIYDALAFAAQSPGATRVYPAPRTDVA